jgi:uncharacterized radical SAM superfamily Fe-S cluster-containing enzyme
MQIDPYQEIATEENDDSVFLFTIIDGIRATWELTGKCDLVCPHCCVNATTDSNSYEPTYDEANYVVDELKKS